VKPRTLARLDLMAAAASVKMREEVVRHNTVLGQIEYQKGVLKDYRGRLKESWRHGGVVAAGQAMRAEVFVAASDEAGGKIAAEAGRTQGMLDDALQALARNQQKRRRLSEVRRKAVVTAERETERRVELAANWRRKDEG
jgi:hypothetical protein